MILLVTGWFDKLDRFGYKTGEKEFLVSHGVDLDMDKIVITPNEPPESLGATFSSELGEWIIV